MRRIVLVLLLAGSALAVAQRVARPEVEKFHSAARLYVAGDTVAAEREAREGLRIAPRDRALQALLAEIERRPPPEPSGGGGQQDQQQPPQSEPDDGDPDRQRGEGERPQDQESDPGERREEADRDQPAADRSGAEQPQQMGDQPAPEPGQMTREEAEALLRALGADERRLLRARRQNADDRQFENDW